MKKSALTRSQIEGGCSVTQNRFRAGLDLPSAFLLMADEETVDLTFDCGPLCSASACPPADGWEQQDALQWIFSAGCPALHRVPVAVIRWELSSSSSGKHHSVTAQTSDTCCPCVPGHVTPATWRARGWLCSVGWSAANTPGESFVSSGMCFPTSAQTAWIS